MYFTAHETTCHHPMWCFFFPIPNLFSSSSFWIYIYTTINKNMQNFSVIFLNVVWIFFVFIYLFIYLFGICDDHFVWMLSARVTHNATLINLQKICLSHLLLLSALQSSVYLWTCFTALRHPSENNKQRKGHAKKTY